MIEERAFAVHLFINRSKLKSVVCTAVSLERGTCLIINKIIINRFVSRVFYIFVGGNVSIFLFFFFSVSCSLLSFVASA